MKRLTVSLISILLLIIVLPVCNSFSIYADEYYPYACNVNEFEVSYIENDGSLTKVSCHSSLSEAKNVMASNQDFVVRYAESLSPTKIVAMNGGIAFTYPGRSDSSTMNIYQNYEKKNNGYRNNEYKYTYVTNHYEMTYYDTLSVNGNSGIVKVTLNGFNGYTDLKNVDLVPFKYLNNGISLYLGGNNLYEPDEDAFRVLVHQDYYILEDNGNYTDLVHYYYRDYPDSSKQNNECISGSFHIDNGANYLAAGMKKNVKYYSSDGINFFSDYNLKTYVATVFGYYEFLSVRSKTNIPASTFDKFLLSRRSSGSKMENEGQAFINAQNNYGSNALIVYAMGCLESGYGTSGYARNRNNLFGWSAYDSDPDNASTYNSIEECVNYQMGENLDWFMDYSNWRYAGTCVGNKGTGFSMYYSSDPFWGEQIAAIAYSIDKYNNNNNGKLTDYNSQVIGFVKDNYNDSFTSENPNIWNVNIYASAYGNDVLYTSANAKHYQNNLLIVIDEKVGNRYKFHLPNPVVNGQLYYDSGIVGYDWENSVGYINCDDVIILGSAQIETNVQEVEGFASLRSVTIENNILTITGIGGIQGVDFSNSNNVLHEIVFNDANDSNIKYSVPVENIDSNGYSLNDGVDYKYTGFSAKANLNDLQSAIGSFYITLRTTAGNYTAENTLRSSNDRFSNVVANISNKIYRLTTNSLYNYRLEFDIFNSQLDFTKINKPTSRQSLVSLDNISISDDGLFSIEAHGMIYYLNYDNKANLEYTVYLLKEDGTYIEMKSKFVENKLDYKKQFNSSYNMDNISFKTSTDLSKVSGKYNLILKIKNGNYIDFVEFTNRSHISMPEKKTNNFEIKILTSNIRNRLYVEAKAGN